MKTQSRLVTALALIALAVLMTFGILRAGRRVQAQSSTPPPTNDRISFGLLGVTRGQTARLNATNAGETHGIIVQWRFLDSDGEVLRNRDGQPVQRTAALEPGHSASLQISADALLGRDEVRLNFRPVLIVIPPPVGDTPILPPGPIVPTLEVIDNVTARTMLLNPGVIRGFNPQPDPPVASLQ